MSSFRSRVLRLIGGALVVALAVPALVAAEEPQAQAPQMSSEEQAMMAAMEKAMTPGMQHQKLAAMAGSWEFKGKFWMQPGGPPTESAGTAERAMMFGGRVMQEKVASAMMGQPFEGMGMTGYDNVSGEWWGTWNDNMGTGVMVSTGKCNDDCTSCEWWGTYNDAFTGKVKKTRMTSEHHADHELHRMYDTGPDGKEFVSMELEYMRKK